MNSDDKKRLDTLEEKVDTVGGDVKDIKYCLMGDPKKADDLGLAGMVSKNTAFRRLATAISGTIGTTLVGALIWLGVKR